MLDMPELDVRGPELPPEEGCTTIGNASYEGYWAASVAVGIVVEVDRMAANPINRVDPSGLEDFAVKNGTITATFILQDKIHVLQLFFKPDAKSCPNSNKIRVVQMINVYGEAGSAVDRTPYETKADKAKGVEGGFGIDTTPPVTAKPGSGLTIYYNDTLPPGSATAPGTPGEHAVMDGSNIAGKDPQELVHMDNPQFSHVSVEAYVVSADHDDNFNHPDFIAGFRFGWDTGADGQPKQTEFAPLKEYSPTFLAALAAYDNYWGNKSTTQPASQPGTKPG